MTVKKYAYPKVLSEWWRLRVPYGGRRAPRPQMDVQFIAMAHGINAPIGRGMPWNKRRKPK